MERKLSRKKDHRENMIRNLATSLVLYEYLSTTEAKAKEVKSFLEGILAKSKTADLNTRRSLLSVFFDKNAVAKIMDELIPRYAERKSGFIRSFRMENRPGDNAPMMRLELVDKKVFVEDAASAKGEAGAPASKGMRGKKEEAKADKKEVKDSNEKKNDNK